jgi:DUF2905 family protein
MFVPYQNRTMDDFSHIGRTLMLVGAAILVIGLALLLVGKVPHVGRLPGDIVWRRGGFTLYFPLVTCLILSLLVSTVLWLVRK